VTSGKIKSLLQQSGPCLSSRLAKQLCQSGLKPDAARQQISRNCRGEIGRLYGLNFPKREGFIFLKADFGSERFVANLLSALATTGSAYNRPLIALTTRDGIMPEKHFATATGLPVVPTKGRIMHSVVVDKLIQLGLIKRVKSSEGDFLALPNAYQQSEHSRAIGQVEHILLGIIRSWLGKTGLASANAIKIRDTETPQFGQFNFDFVGPSYLAGLSPDLSAGRHGFLVGDIILGKEITKQDLEPFLGKWEVLRAQRRSTPFQPVFVADYIACDALHALRQRGCLIAIPATIFGDEVAELLKQLLRTVENAAAVITQKPDEIWTLFKRLSKLEGAAINLRGLFLEMIVGHLLRLEGYQIDFRKQIHVGDRAAEIDVKATNHVGVICCECKALKPGAELDQSHIEKWEQKTIPLIKEWLSHSTTAPEKREFRFYCSATYGEAAHNKLTHLSRTHLKQPISFFDGGDIERALRTNKQHSLADAFREQFSA
jgi:hypothetical protein